MKYLLLLALFASAASADVLVAGDSISLGWTPYLQMQMDGVHHVGRCDKLADFTANGQNSGNSARLTACIPQWLAQYPTGTTVVFNAGMHDVHIAGCKDGGTRRQIGLSDYLSNLQLVIDSIRAAGDVPIFVTTTPVQPYNGSCHFNDDIIDYNNAAVGMMQSQGIQVIDLYAAAFPIQGYLHGDMGIHFTPIGYDFLSHKVFKSLN